MSMLLSRTRSRGVGSCQRAAGARPDRWVDRVAQTSPKCRVARRAPMSEASVPVGRLLRWSENPEPRHDAFAAIAARARVPSASGAHRPSHRGCSGR